MKELTTYNRAAGYLNKLFDLLNEEFFGKTLEKPTITIQSTPKAYGHFSLNPGTWESKNGTSHEINIGAGTLARPIEEVAATLVHEMVHYYCYKNGIQDTSRGGAYHNKRFKENAETRGLIVSHHKKYGWTLTQPGDALLDFILKNDLTDIMLHRNDYYYTPTPGKTGTPTTGTQTTPKGSNSKKYQCPCCKCSVRATKLVRIACLDCGEEMNLCI